MNLPGYDKLNPRTTLEYHIANVYHDKAFIDQAVLLYSAGYPPAETDIQTLAGKYLLTPHEVKHFGKSLKGKFLQLPEARGVMISKYDDKIELSFDAKSSKAEVYEVLEQYFRTRHSLIKLLDHPIPVTKKRKPPENTDLVYSIFRCVEHDHLEFIEVF